MAFGFGGGGGYGGGGKIPSYFEEAAKKQSAQGAGAGPSWSPAPTPSSGAPYQAGSPFGGQAPKAPWAGGPQGVGAAGGYKFFVDPAQQKPKSYPGATEKAPIDVFGGGQAGLPWKVPTPPVNPVGTQFGPGMGVDPTAPGNLYAPMNPPQFPAWDQGAFAEPGRGPSMSGAAPVPSWPEPGRAPHAYGPGGAAPVPAWEAQHGPPAMAGEIDATPGALSDEAMKQFAAQQLAQYFGEPTPTFGEWQKAGQAQIAQAKGQTMSDMLAQAGATGLLSSGQTFGAMGGIESQAMSQGLGLQADIANAQLQWQADQAKNALALYGDMLDADTKKALQDTILKAEQGKWESQQKIEEGKLSLEGSDLVQSQAAAGMQNALELMDKGELTPEQYSAIQTKVSEIQANPNLSWDQKLAEINKALSELGIKTPLDAEAAKAAPGIQQIEGGTVLELQGDWGDQIDQKYYLGSQNAIDGADYGYPGQKFQYSPSTNSLVEVA